MTSAAIATLELGTDETYRYVANYTDDQQGNLLALNVSKSVPTNCLFIELEPRTYIQCVKSIKGRNSPVKKQHNI